MLNGSKVEERKTLTQWNKEFLENGVKYWEFLRRDLSRDQWLVEWDVSNNETVEMVHDLRNSLMKLLMAVPMFDGSINASAWL